MPISFDAQPCAESKIDDLALGQFDAYRREAVDAETIAANHRPLEQQLASLRLYDPARHCATHAGLLLVGKNPSTATTTATHRSASTCLPITSRFKTPAVCMARRRKPTFPPATATATR
jgi:hypothetical protein